ncbi:MAG TPA: RNA polymerase sigma factor [Steroidobacteraceae bacterium]
MMLTDTPASHDSGDELSTARAIARGDQGAFGDLMRRHNQRLYRLARTVLRQPQEAEDALQEAYLQAYRAMRKFRGESSLSTWLCRLVLNECLGRVRRQERRQNILPITADPSAQTMNAVSNDDLERPDRVAARAQMRDLLERTVDELPESFRVIFVLRSVEDLSVEETARCLNLPEATVRTRHFRARSLLRESLARQIDLAEGDLYEFGGTHCQAMVERVLKRL